MLSGIRSKHVILGQEVGPVPVNYPSLGFLLRMDVKLIKDHYLLIFEIVTCRRETAPR